MEGPAKNPANSGPYSSPVLGFLLKTSLSNKVFIRNTSVVINVPAFVAATACNPPLLVGCKNGGGLSSLSVCFDHIANSKGSPKWPKATKNKWHVWSKCCSKYVYRGCCQSTSYRFIEEVLGQINLLQAAKPRGRGWCHMAICYVGCDHRYHTSRCLL